MIFTPKLDFSQPLVDEKGFATLAFQEFLNEISILIPQRGSGSPEGVVNAPLWSEYIDIDGTSGSIKYIKMQSSVGGDTAKGWVLL
jgi:hypothetical protein